MKTRFIRVDEKVTTWVRTIYEVPEDLEDSSIINHLKEGFTIDDIPDCYCSDSIEYPECREYLTTEQNNGEPVLEYYGEFNELPLESF